MSILDLVTLLIVAVFCSFMGQALARYSMGGCITSTLVGFVGAVISTWMALTLELPEFFAINVGGRAFPIVWSMIGSAFFVILLSVLTKGRVTI